MKTENIFIAHPQTNEQLEALKAFMQALKIKFEISTKQIDNYNPEFVDKILQGDKDIAEGKGKKITLDELNKLWK
jgi:hypothetical protein